jgi:hypothetical protein
MPTGTGVELQPRTVDDMIPLAKSNFSWHVVACLFQEGRGRYSRSKDRQPSVALPVRELSLI